MLKETLDSFLFYIFAESIVPVSDQDAKKWALEAASDGLFDIPDNTEWGSVLSRARVDAQEWIASKNV